VKVKKVKKSLFKSDSESEKNEKITFPLSLSLLKQSLSEKSEKRK